MSDGCYKVERCYTDVRDIDDDAVIRFIGRDGHVIVRSYKTVKAALSADDVTEERKPVEDTATEVAVAVDKLNDEWNKLPYDATYAIGLLVLKRGVARRHLDDCQQKLSYAHKEFDKAHGRRDSIDDALRDVLGSKECISDELKRAIMGWGYNWRTYGDEIQLKFV